MSIVNNNVTVVDLPMWEILQPAPVASAVGVCCCNDERGSNRHIYFLFSATSFWRYDTFANTWQQLANPPGGTVGAGSSLIFDPSRGTAGYVWALISNGSATPTWQYYDISTNTWTARSVTNLPSTFGTDSSLCHTCSTYDAAGNDDYIYLIGNNATAFYRYSITGNSWSTLTVALSASGAGCNLLWLPTYNTDRLVRVRGGATNVVDYYSITGTGWTGITYQPSTETLTTGSYACIRSGMDHLLVQKDATMRIFNLDLGDSIMNCQVTQFIIATSTAVVGNRMCYVKETNGIEFLYMLLHTSSSFLRTPLFF